MKTLITSLAVIFVAVNIFAQKTNLVTEIWKTEQKLQTPESVLYYPKDNILFVSNIAGKPSEKDNTGFISKVNLSGDIINLKWVEGISAPKGMAVKNELLYVSNIDELVEINIVSGKITRRYKAPGAQFLNDVAVNNEGVVFVSDMSQNKIWYLTDNKFDIWYSGKDLQSPNGLYAEKDYLLIGNSNYILKVDYKNKNSEKYIKNTGSIDGLVPIGNGAYFISDWLSHVYLVKKGAERKLIFDSEKEGVNAADIEYIQKEKILLIPTFFDNRVIAYKFTY